MSRSLPAVLALLGFAACQKVFHIPTDAGFGGGAGGGAAGGSGGSGGSGGGAAGGTAGGSCTAFCDGGCGSDGCGGLCRVAGFVVPDVDAGLYTLSKPPDGVGLSRLWGTSATDLWVLQDTQWLFHWNGSGWGCVRTTEALKSYDVWSRPGEAWVVTDSLTAPVMRFRLDGGTTTHFNPPALAPIHAVWGSGARQWFGAEDGALLRLDGNTWMTEFPGGTPIVDLQGLDTAAEPILYAAMRQQQLSRSSLGPSWSTTTLNTRDVTGIAPIDGGWVAVESTGTALIGSGAAWSTDGVVLLGSTPEAVSSGGGETYAVGRSGASGFLARRDPALGWQPVVLHPRALHDVWVAPDAGAWIAGNAGTVMLYTAPVCPNALPIADEFSGPLSSGWGNGTASTGSGRLFMTPYVGADNDLAATLATRGFVGKALSVELVQRALIAGNDTNTHTALFALTGDLNHRLEISAQDDQLNARLDTTLIGQVNADNGAFIRIRETAGFVLFEYFVPDAGWSLIADAGSPAWLSDIAIVGLTSHAQFDGGPLSPAIFDNLNRRCPP